MLGKNYPKRSIAVRVPSSKSTPKIWIPRGYTTHIEQMKRKYPAPLDNGCFAPAVRKGYNKRINKN